MGRARSKSKLQLDSTSSGGGVMEAGKDAGAQGDLLTCSKSRSSG